MAISKMEPECATKNPTRKSFSTDLLQGRFSRRAIGDKQFAELFKLFFSAVDHELGNSLVGTVGLIELGKNKELARVADELYYTYKRINILQTLALGSRSSCSLARFFSVQEIENLRIGDDQSTSDIEAIKEVGLQEVRKFRALLLELNFVSSNLPPEEYSGDKFGPSMVQSLKFGLLLSNCLEKLMLGSLDLDAQLMSRKVGNILNNASKAGCVFECHYRPPRIKGSRVIVNPIFSALIFLNIFSNSKRALEKKGMEPKVEVSIRRKGDMAAFEFTDEGCGMPPRIMEKLNAGLSVTTKEESGEHGIGFQYCRELAEKMGGRLYVKESTMEVGTTVTLELKLAE